MWKYLHIFSISVQLLLASVQPGALLLSSPGFVCETLSKIQRFVKILIVMDFS